MAATVLVNVFIDCFGVTEKVPVDLWRKKSGCINYEGQSPEIQSYLDVHVNTLTEENLPSIVGLKGSPSLHFGSSLPLTETLLPQQKAVFPPLSRSVSRYSSVSELFRQFS